MICKMGKLSLYIISIITLSLKRVSSASIETRKLWGSDLTRWKILQRFFWSYSMCNVSIVECSGLALSMIFNNLPADGWKNCRWSFRGWVYVKLTWFISESGCKYVVFEIAQGGCTTHRGRQASRCQVRFLSTRIVDWKHCRLQFFRGRGH